MKRPDYILVLVALFAFVLCLHSPTQAADFSMEGEWLGGVVYRHSDTCSGHWSPIKLYFWRDGGNTNLSIDYPNERLFDLSFSKIEVGAEEILLEHVNASGDKLTFVGTRNGDLIEGEYQKNGEPFGSFQIVQNRDAKVVKHQPIPDFKVPLLDDQETASKSDLLGKYYLIDFWFTGCSVCTNEMPNLHELYEKYKDQNFTILSLSIDENAELVRAYRKKSWAMPWMNAHLAGSWEDPLLKAFEFKGSPTVYLVSPQGTVLATTDQLLGENLEKTLARYLD